MILAIDCGTKTGWCLMSDGKVLDSGVQHFEKKRGDSNGILFARFRAWLQSMLSDNKDIDLVVYELPHIRGGYATDILVNLAGRIQEACDERGIEYASVHSASLKKFATGCGNADKSMMEVQAEMILGRRPIDDNESDAALLGMWGYNEFKVK